MVASEVAEATPASPEMAASIVQRFGGFVAKYMGWWLAT
jgi:hypothetical protein